MELLVSTTEVDGVASHLAVPPLAPRAAAAVSCLSYCHRTFSSYGNSFKRSDGRILATEVVQWPYEVS